jgi:hypothetical protein
MRKAFRSVSLVLALIAAISFVSHASAHPTHVSTHCAICHTAPAPTTPVLTSVAPTWHVVQDPLITLPFILDFTLLCADFTRGPPIP